MVFLFYCMVCIAISIIGLGAIVWVLFMAFFGLWLIISEWNKIACTIYTIIILLLSIRAITWLLYHLDPILTYVLNIVRPIASFLTGYTP